MVNDERWLIEWIELIQQYADDGLVLELGSGTGRDSEVLCRRGFKVIALDISLESLQMCSRLENCIPLQADLACGLPFLDNTFKVILASLSLHYFDWSTTLKIVDEMKRVLRPSGLLLVRVNATDDYNFGAGQGAMIEENFYKTNSRSKRFFDETTLKRLLVGLEVKMLRHKAIDRYGKTKKVWEAYAVT